jgi:phosphoglycolate phosphatase
MNALFDLDGTLTDSQLGITRCIRHGMEAIGHPLAEDIDLRWCIGPQLADSFATMLGEHRDLAADALRHYRERYGDVGMFENEMYPGVSEVLTQIRASGIQLFVATSKPHVFARQVIDHFGLSDCFERVHGSELDGTRCDKTDLIRYVLEQNQMSPADAVMIGDRQHDIVGARANGLRSVGVLWGYGSRNELETAGADAIVDAVAQLPAAI